MRNSEMYTEEDIDRLYFYPDGNDHRLKTTKKKSFEAGHKDIHFEADHKEHMMKETESKAPEPEKPKSYHLSADPSEFAATTLSDSWLRSIEEAEAAYISEVVEVSKEENKNYKTEEENIVAELEEEKAPNNPMNDDWKTNKYLPEGWTCKEGLTKVCIQTNTGLRLKCYRAAAEYMEDNSEYTKEDMEQIYLYPDGKNHAQHLPLDEDWKTNEYLSAGWMCKDKKEGSSKIKILTNTAVHWVQTSLL